jgi:hypothetical protein
MKYYYYSFKIMQCYFVMIYYYFKLPEKTFNFLY